MQRKASDSLFSIIKHNISPTNLVLDAGCGTGYFHELLRKNKIYCPLVQADISVNMCAKAAEYASPIEYGGTYTVAGDIDSLPFAEGLFDLVFSSLTLQWSHDIAASLGEMRKVMKTAATLAISVIGQGTLRELSESFSAMDGLPHINNNFTISDALYSNLAAAGFSDISIVEEEITDYHSDIMGVIKSIKGVGAGYKSLENRPYLGREYFKRLGAVYQEKFGNENGLPASWSIIYAVATK